LPSVIRRTGICWVCGGEMMDWDVSIDDIPTEAAPKETGSQM
jgi:hypothetical protein